jgi:anti-anti-sigma factor
VNLNLQSDEGEFVRVALSGEVLQRYTLTREDLLSSVVGANCYQRRVLLDLSGVRTIDSGGVGWLLGCQKRFRTGGGAMVLHSLSPLAREILGILKMHLVFQMAEDESAARALCAPPVETSPRTP